MAKRSGKDLMIGAVVGGVLGAVTALLFAPKPGKELRADIADQVRTASAKTQKVAKQVGEHTVGIVNKAKHAAGSLADDIRSWRGQRSDAQEQAEPAIEALNGAAKLAEDEAPAASADESFGAEGEAADTVPTNH